MSKWWVWFLLSYRQASFAVNQTGNSAGPLRQGFVNRRDVPDFPSHFQNGRDGLAPEAIYKLKSITSI
jgi:hypothetical protein